jgi:AcrR family transcriptional regulator
MPGDAPQQQPAAPGAADRKPPAAIGAATKLRYLRAAAELAAEEAVGPDASAFAVSRVTMADVAADLGVARTTLYRLWPSKLDFWADLTAYIASTALRPTADEVAASILQAPLAGDAAPSAMPRARAALNAVQQRQLVNPWTALRTALLGYAGSERLDALVGAANSREIDEAAAQVDRILAQLGLAPREPLTVRDIAVVGFCIADGLATAGLLSPRITREDIVLDGDPAGWGMLAFAIRAVIRSCTRARTATDGSPAPLFDAVPPAAALDHLQRWTEPQRTALAAAARRFATRDNSGSDRVPSPLGHVTLARLARHTGVSRQWLHRIWPTQHAFAADLIAHLFEQRCELVLVELRRATRRSMEVPFGGTLVATDGAFGALAGFAASGPLSHLMYASHEDDPVISDRCRVALESMLDRFAADLDALTRSWGGSTREGVAFFHLAALIALTELAAARLERTNPGLVRRRLPYRGGEWSALAIAIEAIVAYSLGLPIEERPVVDGHGQAL